MVFLIMKLLQNPIIVNINDWLMDNIGLVAVGKRVPDDNSKVKLYAIEHGDAASLEMAEFAKKIDAIILVSVPESDIGAID